MTELAVYQPPQAVSPMDYQDRAVARLAEWAHAADAAHAVASKLVQSAFVPVAFRGKPVEATAAILAGAEVGLSPMSALRAFDVIQGQAAARAITLRAIAQSFGHEMVLIESTATRCRMKGKRRGSELWQEVVWTIDRARDLGLTSKDGWKKQPIAMLQARATSELARLIAADAILGIGYSAEEIADGVTGDAPVESAPDPQPAQSGTRRMSRKPPVPAVPDPEPESDEPAPDDPLVDPKSDQFKRLHALLNEKGYRDRGFGLAFMGDVLGRDVDSSKGITRSEASRVIDALVALPEPADDEAWPADDGGAA